MARDVTDDTYYVSSGGKIPVKWTAPEVYSQLPNALAYNCKGLVCMPTVKYLT